uniref:Pept_C1 domain-containing protein n=2 Tax=Caenorhabditis tropicalis TaxID=1561998 RepID=A0A1I7UIP2_9PELO
MSGCEMSGCELSGCEMSGCEMSWLRIVPEPFDWSFGGEIRDVKYINAFQEFLVKYLKEYKTNEEIIQRFTIFSRNFDLVERYNLEDAGKVTYELNEFSDLSDEEWKKFLMTPRPGKPRKTSKALSKSLETLPDTVDWRNVNETNHVTGIKYQGPCGSCWAFATAAAIESAVSINGGGLENLSSQQLLDCTPISDKCSGGEPIEALSFAQTHGITSARNYPYYFWTTKCQETVPTVARISGWIEADGEEEMARIVGSKGPMIVCANFATNKNRFYRGGIADDPDCGTEPTHALVVVGYGPDYWILKNTYSKVWGERGYMRVRRGVNWCGINTEKPLLPVL